MVYRVLTIKKRQDADGPGERRGPDLQKANLPKEGEWEHWHESQKKREWSFLAGSLLSRELGTGLTLISLSMSCERHGCIHRILFLCFLKVTTSLKSKKRCDPRVTRSSLQHRQYSKKKGLSQGGVRGSYFLKCLFEEASTTWEIWVASQVLVYQIDAVTSVVGRW